MKRNIRNYFEQLFHDKGKLPLCNQLTVISNKVTEYKLGIQIWYKDK